MKDQKTLIINSLTSFKEMQVRQPPKNLYKSTWLPVISVELPEYLKLQFKEKKKECQYSNIQSSDAILFLVNESVAYIQIIL